MFNLPNHFVSRKKEFMKKLEDAIKMNLVDEDIIDILYKMNKLPVLYTTSSCSGRIFLVDIPNMGRKDMSIKVAKWHREVSFEEFFEKIEGYDPKGILWLKVEGMIIAFAVLDISWASFFIRLSRLFGYKDSGIRSISADFKHIIMDVSATEKMHVPIAIKNRGVIHSQEDLNRLVNIANWLLRRTKIKLKVWEKIIERIDYILNTKEIINPSEIDFKSFDDLVKLKKTMLMKEEKFQW